MKYPLFKVHVPVADATEAVKEVLRSGFINEGIQVAELTHELQRILRTEELILTNSCTSSLTMALKLAGVGPGDEVISTPMTCVATNAAIASTGARIVWADVDPRSGLIDPNSVASNVNSRTKAVMAVAWAGTPPDLFHLNALCGRCNLKLILDAAHAFNAYYCDHPIHRWADYTAYSFQAIKQFTTGDGGALVCLKYDDHVRSKAMKWFGIDRDRAKDAHGDWKGQQWDVDIEEIGFKFNMNNVAAAIGLSQVPHVPHILGKHLRHAELYDELFKDFDPVKPAGRPKGAQSSFWVYTVIVDPSSTSLQRDPLLKALNDEGIMAGVVHVPNDGYSCFSEARADLPGVRAFSANQLSLPCGWWLHEGDVSRIASRVKELTR